MLDNAIHLAPALVVQTLGSAIHLAQVVETLDKAIHRINYFAAGPSCSKGG